MLEKKNVSIYFFLKRFVNNSLVVSSFSGAYMF